MLRHFVRNTLFVIFVCFVAALLPVFAQNNTLNDQAVCADYTFTLDGLSAVKKDTPQTYTFKNNEWVQFSGVNISHQISKNNELLATMSGTNMIYQFTTWWAFTITSSLTTGSGCVYIHEKNVQVYTTFYTYVGEQKEEFSLAQQSLTDTGVYLQQVIINDINTLTQDQVNGILADNVHYIQYADRLILDGDVVGVFFDTLSSLQQFVWLHMENTDTYILANINQSAFRRMIARYDQLVGIEQVNVVQEEYVGSLLTSLFLEKDLSELDIVRTYAVSLAYSKKRLVMSYLVDYLLHNNFPLSTLLVILMLPILALLISVFRQVIWLSVFGIFNPLLFAFSLHIMWLAPTIIFFVAAFVATFLLKLFTSKIYILYSPKIALLIILYMICSLIMLAIVPVITGYQIDYTVFQNSYILFPFLFLIVIGNSVFTEKFLLFDTWRWIWLIEFVFVSACVYWILKSSRVQNLVLWYPELSLISIILVIVVGRFTWLQLSEYLRFLPLIRHYFEEEE